MSTFLRAAALAVSLVSLLVLTGCAVSPAHSRAYVSDSILGNSGHALASESATGDALPPAVNVEDGVSADEAVAIALWSNPELQADLSGLGFARADLLEAGLLPNPVFSLLFPVGPKQFEATLSMPLEVLWQRHHRVAIADADASVLAENLVQNGLDLVRRVRTAFVNLRLAGERRRLAEDEVALQTEALGITKERLRAGDVDAAAVAACRLALAEAREQALRAALEARGLTIALHGLLGHRCESATFTTHAPATNATAVASTDTLVKRALASRPDLRAAELAMEAAGQRIGLARSKIFDLTVVLDANGDGSEGFEMGPGLRFSLPVLNQNQGEVARNQAELARCVYRYLAVKHRIKTAVVQAHADHVGASELLSILRNEVVGAARETSRHAEQAFEAGDSCYVELLIAQRQELLAQVRAAEAEAALQRSLVNLAFSVGSGELQSD